jgi:hypothetical protein
MEPLVRLELLVSPAQQARWACLVPPELQELQALTVQQEPPASLVYLAQLVQPGSTGQQVPLESRAVMVLLA